jgi:hypothetical protein
MDLTSLPFPVRVASARTALRSVFYARRASLNPKVEATPPIEDILTKYAKAHNTPFTRSQNSLLSHRYQAGVEEVWERARGKAVSMWGEDAVHAAIVALEGEP